MIINTAEMPHKTDAVTATRMKLHAAAAAAAVRISAKLYAYIQIKYMTAAENCTVQDR